MSQQGPLRRICSLGALGEGSGWDLRIHPAAASGFRNLGTWKSGTLDLGTWKSKKLEIWGPENPEMWGPNNQKENLDPNPFCLKCRQRLD